MSFSYRKVSPVPQCCRYCGYGPCQPRESYRFDNQGSQIWEARWVCGNCRRMFDQGITKIIEKKHENG